MLVGELISILATLTKSAHHQYSLSPSVFTLTISILATLTISAHLSWIGNPVESVEQL